MSQGSSKIRIVTQDEALFATARGAVAGLEDWELAEPQSVEQLSSDPPESGDVVLLDAWMQSENVYESCRRLTGKTRCRTFLVTDDRNHYADAIAAFCGATGTIERPLSADKLRHVLEVGNVRPTLPHEGRGQADDDRLLPESLMRDLVGDESNRLVDALIDPETGLFSYDYLSFKLDEEYKRSKRFGLPLSCVMLGFDGRAEESVLGALAGIILNASRDTDLLGRFDESSFLFFLPNTGPDGAEIMARRIQSTVEEEGLRDLVGDPLEISVGISYFPSLRIERREDLFSLARDAFLEALHEGGVIVSGS